MMINIMSKNTDKNIKFGDDKKNNLSELISDQFTGYSIDLSNLGALSSEDFQKVIDALKKNTTITTLYLSGNNIGDKGAEKLAKALEKNTTITKLSLRSNNIGKAGAEVLAQALKENKTLTELDLGWNNIGDEGAEKLAEALKNNETLTTLDLSDNNIGEVGAKALAEALKENKTLTELNLSYNKEIGDKGAQELAQALKENKTLTKLNLSYNDIKDKQVIALGIACKDKKNITVNFGDNEKNDSFKQNTVNFGDNEKNDLFKQAQKYSNEKAESSYFFNIPAAATGIFTASTIIALLTIITLSILASQGIIAFDSAAFIAPVASVGAINLVTFIGFAITEVTSKVKDYKNVSEYNKVHESDKGFKPQKVHWLNPCHKVQFVDKVSQEQNNNEKTPLIGK
jgi:hypothetical protein